MSEDDSASSAARWSARSGKALRDFTDPGWDAIADSVIDAVRATPRGGWPLRVRDPNSGGSPRDLVTVSDLVLRGALARALRFEQVAVPSTIELFVDGDHLRRVRIELTGRYGAELCGIADRARASVVNVVEEMLGIAVLVDGIDIEITDIVDGDPTQSDASQVPRKSPLAVHNDIADSAEDGA